MTTTQFKHLIKTAFPGVAFDFTDTDGFEAYHPSLLVTYTDDGWWEVLTKLHAGKYRSLGDYVEHCNVT